MSYIGVFDSGIGGISTLATAMAALPQENFIYYADSAHVPYGGRPREQILSLTRACIGEMLPLGLKALVLACNAATSAGAAQLRDELELPVLGVEPAVKPALTAVTGPVIMLGTEMTVRGEKFRRLLSSLPGGERVIALACPGLADLVEQDAAHPELEPYLRQKLAPYEDSMAAMVLGCTHYVFLRPLLNRLWPHIPLFDGNEGLSRHLARVIEQPSVPAQPHRGELLFMCSDKGEQAQKNFAARCQRYLEVL